MSIFKETFPKFVRDQLGQREEIIASGAGRNSNGAFNFKQTGGRSEKFYTYTLNKQCVLRMSSAVDIIDEKIFTEDTGTGASVAENWVLEGGIKNKGLNRGGFTNGKNTNTAYGDKDIRSNAADGYGIVPMPGITSATVRTKSAYGSLREAKVSFVCHNKRQLEVLELLYMRPGYTLMLEWGWDPYINNEGKKDSWTFIDSFFDTQKKTKELEREILKKKEDTGGNYDAILGYCKNFNYNLRKDGGFNCSTEIIAKGEVLSSLKDITTLVSEKIKNQGEQVYSRPALELIFQQLINFSDDVEKIGSNKKAKERIEQELPDIQKKLKINVDTLATQDVDEEGVPLSGDEEIGGENTLKPWILADGPKGYQQKDYLTFWDDDEREQDGNYWNARDRRTTTTWIRWDALAYLITEYVVPKDDNGVPLVEIQTNRIGNEHGPSPTIDPLLYCNHTPYQLAQSLTEITHIDKVRKIDWNITDISTNNQICMFPHNLYQHSMRIPEAIEHSKLYPPMAENMKKHLTSGKDADISRELLMWEQHHQIGGIYLGVEWLMSTYKNMYYDEDGNADKDYSLFDFLKEIWEGVNKVCGDNHEFTLNTDNRPGGKVVRIIDMQAEAVGLVESEIHELKIQSLDSTVRDISYNTTIPSSLSSTIAIAAQNPDSVDNLDRVSFAALNKGIRDRFSTNVTNNKAGFFGGNDSEEIAQKLKWNQKFDMNLKRIYEALYIFDHESWKEILGETSDTFSWWEAGATAAALYTAPATYGISMILPTIIAAPKITKQLNRNFGGVLRDLLYYQYTINDNQYLREEAQPSVQNEVAAKYKGSLKDLHKAINYFSKVYGSNDTQTSNPRYFRGQPYSGASRRTSSIIPLKFNAKMDGISGLVIGNIFKLPKSRLPMAYNGNDIKFIVMGEQQEISAGQDWTTTLTGQITLLGGDTEISHEHQLWLDSWKKENIDRESSTTISEQSIRDMNIENYDDGEDYEYNNTYGDYVTQKRTSLCDPLDLMPNPVDGQKYGYRIHPVKGGKKMHAGIDISTGGERVPVYAVWDGTVSVSSNSKSCGGMIYLSFSPMDYEDGSGASGFPVANEKGRSQVQPRVAQYCHLSSFKVDDKDIVKKGQLLGMSGGGANDPMKGTSSARHLHFALRTKISSGKNNALPPAPWLPDNDTWLEDAWQWFGNIRGEKETTTSNVKSKSYGGL